MPGPTLRVKHIILALAIALAGVVIASFARPRTPSGSSTSSYNR
jgi:hypothetical protein